MKMTFFGLESMTPCPPLWIRRCRQPSLDRKTIKCSLLSCSKCVRSNYTSKSQIESPEHCFLENPSPRKLISRTSVFTKTVYPNSYFPNIQYTVVCVLGFTPCNKRETQFHHYMTSQVNGTWKQRPQGQQC